MSRWIDNFERHPFKVTWKDLKEKSKLSKIDDASIKTSLQELTRFKKVVDYIDELLENIDPELTPLSIWDSFNSQAVAARDQIANFNSNLNITHLSNANNNLDNLLTYVRPYMVLPKNAAAAITRAISKQTSVIDKYIEEFDSNASTSVKKINRFLSESKSDYSKILESKERIIEFDDELFRQEGVSNKFNNLQSQFEDSVEEVKNYHDELLIGSEESISIKAKIIQADEQVHEIKSNSQEAFDKVTAKIDALSVFYNKVEGVENDEGEREGGLKDELDKLFEKLSVFETKQKIKIKALSDQVEALLPGATSAGLAYKFRALRKSFSKPVKVYSRLFYGTVTALFIVSLFFIIDEIQFWSITFVDLGDYKLLIKNTLYKLPLLLPVLWLALFASKRRSESQRLQQEYAHKEAIASSYQSFKKQIEQLNDDNNELKIQLLNTAINAISYNASETLDRKHGDKLPIQEIIDATVKETVKAASK